jgi:glycosyltransferase involved in cell wall biosynthesis
VRSFLAPSTDRPVAAGPTPTFSIVISAYEAAGFIDRAVESALAQTVPAVEIIVSDDGSNDDLEGALAPYRDRVALLRGPHVGPPAARNRGFRAASGDFVANLDADDLLHPQWLEALGELSSARPDLDILSSDAYLVSAGHRLRRCYSKGWIFYTDDQRRRILQHNFICPGALAAVRRKRFVEIRGFDESIPWCDDWDFWLRLILSGSRAGCVDEPLADWTVRQDSVSTRRIDVIRDAVRLLEKADADPGLGQREREALAVSIAQRRRELARLEAREAIVRGARGARGKALAVALDPGQPARTRFKTAASTVAPRVGGHLLRARDEQVWLGAGGPEIERRLRVAFYCDSDRLGGAEASLANLLAALDPEIDAVVVGTDHHVVEWIASHRAGAATLVLRRVGTKWKARAIVEHFRALRRLRPDILQVNLNTPGASPWAVLCGLASPGVRVIAVEHLPQPIPRLPRRAVKRLTNPHLAAHVAVGERSAEELARLIGVSRSSIRTIHNGVPDLELEGLPRSTNGPVIGSIGRLDPQKGYDVLVRALRELPGVTAVVVGEGAEREGLVDLARRLDVSDRLRLVGWSDEPRRFLTTFDLFVLPSRFEGFPLGVVEAMLAGVPVVATDVGSVAEAVVDGETGLLVPAGDPSALARAVRELLDDRARMQEMSRRGRARAGSQFTLEEMAKAYEALYQEVVR